MLALTTSLVATQMGSNMAYTSSKSLSPFLALNLLFFTYASACGECGSGQPKPTPKPSKPHPTPGGYPGSGGSPSTPGGGSPSTPEGGSPSTPGGGSPSTPGGGSSGACPIDALKLGVCANVLGGLLNLNLGTPPRTPCCPLIQGLIDAEAALCLCTVIRANILGINLNVPLSLSLLVNYCGRTLPRGFQCPN